MTISGVASMKAITHVHCAVALVIFVGAISACSPTSEAIPSSAQIESVGILAYQANQRSAIEQLRRWAKNGQPVAARELGLTYAKHVQTYPEAVQWLEMASVAGDSQAQFALAKANYESQLGLAKNFAKAWKWFELSANQGDGKASFMLARMASHGEGVPKDEDLAVQWLQTASKQKNAQAMYQLSVAYSSGNGIARNVMMGRYWLNLSAEYDYSIAIQALAMELDGLGGVNSPFAERSRQLFKEASDHRLMRWNTHL
jgi:TPR repeat protein